MTRKTVNFSISPVVAKAVKQNQVIAKVTGKTVKANTPEKTVVIGNIPDSVSVTGNVIQSAAGDANSRGMFLPEQVLSYQSIKVSAHLNKTDVSNLTEALALLTHKTLEVPLSAYEAISFTSATKVGHTAVGSSSVVFQFQAGKEDRITFEETLSKAIGFGAKTVGSVEVLNKLFSNSHKESYSAADMLSLLLLRPLHDVSTAQESLGKHVYLHLLEVVLAEDSADVIVVPELRRDFSEEPSIEESITMIANALKEHSAGTFDVVSISVEKPLQESSSVADVITLDLTLGKMDVVGSTEVILKLLQKPSLASQSSVSESGVAIVQSYYASDFYWDDFHGVSHTSLG